MNKTITIIAILAIIFLAGILIFTGSSQNESQPAKGEGSIYFSVTDVAADMDNVSEITLTTDSVAVHSQSSGWVEASSANESYNLLELNASGESKLWAKANVAADTYDKIRLAVDNVEVTTTDGTTTEAKLPSNTFTIQGNVNVSEQATSSVNFDVLADKSLHTAEDGSYIFAPVVKMEARSNADVAVSENNTVRVSGGMVDSNVTVGVDLAGNSGVGVTVDPDQSIEVSKDGSIKLDMQPGQGTSTRDGGNQSAASANVEAGASASGGNNNSNTNAEGNVEVDANAGVQY